MGTSRLLKKDANGEEIQAPRTPLYSLPQGQYVLGIGIIF